MIVYTGTKKTFSNDVVGNEIVDKVLACLKGSVGHFVGEGEVRAFQHSLLYMNNVLLDKGIPNDSGVSIEYQIPQTGKRIDFIISGLDERSSSTAILIELKQWSEGVSVSAKDGVVNTKFFGEVSHPSYQVWSYAALLEDFNDAVQSDHIALRPCAYLHNYEPDNVITNSFYGEYLQKAPVFLKPDVLKLREFIKKYVKHGDSGAAMYRIDHGRIRPSKSLADKLASLLQGNQEFIMIDDQKVVYETALELAKKANSGGGKHVLIVEGGPGTGKSVVAVNLLVTLIGKEINARYVTKNAAPREVYESKLSGVLTKTRITNLFNGSGAYTECPLNTFDALIVDEAHRLNERSGMFQNKGENQIKEIIQAARVSVFFIDEDQRVTLKDIGEKEEIVRWAKRLGASVHNRGLSSQFRCNGSDGYLAWLDDTLQIRKTSNTSLDDVYDFRVIGSPSELRDLIYEKNKISNKARLVAGYCWDWVSKNDPSAKDIEIPEYNFSMRWNLSSDGNLWILKSESVTEVGCIHTCQGLEMDYVGVIIGEDLICRDGVIIADPKKRARTDSSVKGYKKLLKTDPEQAKFRMDAIIKNTYRTLMTRGMKGCYVYCVDKELEAYLRSRIKEIVPRNKTLFYSDVITVVEEERFKLEESVDQKLRHKDYLPVYTLEAACGLFGRGTDAQEEGWLKVDGFQLNMNMFVARVVGKSMEPRIPDGSYCVFQANVVGSRNDKIVLVQLNTALESESGGRYTVKKYSSKKRTAGLDSWEHEEIVLLPLNPAYQPIVVPKGNDGEFMVVAELVRVL